MKASDFFLDREDKVLGFSNGVNVNHKEAAFRMALLNTLDYLDGKIDGTNQSCENQSVSPKFEYRFIDGANLKQGPTILISWRNIETVLAKVFNLKENERLAGIIINEHGIRAVID